MKEQLLILFAAAFGQIGESKLVDVLQQLHDKHPLQYEAAIKGFSVGVKALLPLVEASKTPIDNLFLNALNDAVIESAKNNNVKI